MSNASGARHPLLELTLARFREFLTAELGDDLDALGEAGAPGALGSAISAGQGANA